jgi:cytochrome c peroxidase
LSRDPSRLALAPWRGGRALAFALALVASCAPLAAPEPDIEGDEIVPLVSDGDLVLAIPPVVIDAPRASLGERLFRDPRLSHDGAVSCTSCHDLEAHGGGDGLAHSALDGRPPGPINVPTVFNVGLNFRWSWTGRWQLMADQIDAAMRAPHAMATPMEDVVPLLADGYSEDFAAVYPDGLTVSNVRDALTEYLRSLTTPHARFDQFLNGDPDALTEDELRGWALFREIGCVSCHQGVNIGGNLFQRFGVVESPDPDAAPEVRVFRVPSLRNVALTAPYFHDGRAATLEDAVQTMARVQLGRQLRPDQVEVLVAFLRTLTGDRPGHPAP